MSGRISENSQLLHVIGEQLSLREITGLVRNFEKSHIDLFAEIAFNLVGNPDFQLSSEDKEKFKNFKPQLRVIINKSSSIKSRRQSLSPHLVKILSQVALSCHSVWS